MTLKVSKWFLVLMIVAGALAMYGDATWYIDNTTGNPGNWLDFPLYTRWNEYAIMLLIATTPYTMARIRNKKRQDTHVK